MRGSFAHFIRTNRNALAVAMLCVLVLKGFSFLGMTAWIAADPSVHNSFAEKVVLGTHCQEVGDEKEPTQRHLDCEQCCAFCSSLLKDVAILDIGLSKILAVLMPVKEAQTVVYAREDKYSPMPPGWESNWSATAPPAA